MKRILFVIAFATLTIPFAFGQSYSTVNTPIHEGGDCFSMTNYSNLHSATGVWSNSTLLRDDLMTGTPIVWDFEIYLGTEDAGGHGMAFVLQQEGPGAIGMGGAGLGYAGNSLVAPSVALEIDTKENSHDNINVTGGDDHMSAHFNGDHLLDAVAPVAIPNVEDGVYHHFQVVWTFNAATPSLSTLTGTLDASHSITVYFNPAILFDKIHAIYFGFTAGISNNYVNDQRVAFGLPGTVGSCSENISLPVEMAGFAAEARPDQSVDLFWATSSELNNDYFEIMRSTDGILWQSIGSVKGVGTTQSLSTYEFTDNQAQPWKNYYKLRQVDFDGRFTYSDVLEVEVDPTQDQIMSVFPNPTEGAFTLRLLDVDAERNFRLEIFDNMGRRLVEEVVMTTGKGYHDMPYQLNGMESGIYIVKLSTSQHSWTQRLMVK